MTGLLLDSHAFLWWTLDDKRLSRVAREAISDRRNKLILSAASVYELRYKFEKGRLPGAGPLFRNLYKIVASQDIEIHPVTFLHAETAAALSSPLKDPFDRILIAVALEEDFTLVTKDRAIKGYDVKTLW